MQHTLALTLTNESTTGCYLYGYPGISLVDAQGNVLPLDYEWTGDQVVTSRPPSRVDVAPGTVAYVTTNKNTCVSADLASAVSVRLIPPDDLSALSVSIAGNVSMDYCGVGDPGSVLHISPVEPSYLDTIAH